MATRPHATLARLGRRYDALLREIGKVGYVASGSLAPRYNRCGKANCRCQGDPPQLHGPYWHFTAKVDGKTVNRRLTDAEAAIYQEWIANDRHLRSLIDELHTVAREALEITLDEARKAS